MGCGDALHSASGSGDGLSGWTLSLPLPRALVFKWIVVREKASDHLRLELNATHI